MSLHPGTFVLDPAARHPSDGARPLPQWFSDPVMWLRADHPGDVVSALVRAETERRRGRWVGGFVAYEAAAAWGLPVRPPVDGMPLVVLGVYEQPAAAPPASPARPVSVRLDPAWSARQHGAAHERIRSLIREGDVYQVNLTFPIRADLPTARAWDLFRQAYTRQPVAYGAYLQGDGWAIGSLSPELFFRVEGDRIWTRPMKGTAAPGADSDELTSDPKSRAENLMIVDLLRNDLSRVARPGSVRVPSLFEVERYATLTQMTSTVEATLLPDVGAPELFEALFPCGSVTGAPKRRAMQRICEVEAFARGPYCGAVGMMAPDGRSVFSVAIRTFVAQGGALTMGVGSGIVWDSVASSEYAESLLKAAFLRTDG